jgi:hypothetical protein
MGRIKKSTDTNQQSNRSIKMSATFVQLNEFGIIARADALISAIPVATILSSSTVIRDMSATIMVSEQTTVSVAVRFEISESLYDTLANSGYEDRLSIFDPNDDGDEVEDIDGEDDEAEEEEEEEEKPTRGRGRGRKAIEPEPEPEEMEMVVDELPVQYFLTSDAVAHQVFESVKPLVETDGFVSLAEQSEHNALALHKRIERFASYLNEFHATRESLPLEEDEDDLQLTSAPASVQAQAAFHQSQTNIISW